ncbi:NAD(P)-dependent alcohol dehydrogenase [Phytoactinopolyspora halotolerans]|uniref:alcohol dehydrogenase (NADP(+)) n=1 Tax=Phytoactinopolyspora halotolerans TaxID=1981512 RepID=A0A6L9SGP0_9ACTN|nr:NAD(P)-dependent alcohol dehydrogenase [Phytoactinopolyspora halotolerans]NEE04446.1 NAD(P)-dependent alcohol dehydrogenase [Phytoactinopolyspora halotolerans]
MRLTTGYAAHEPGEQLRPWSFPRRELRPDDVAIEVMYCGVCHSDLHALHTQKSESGPLVPGHEFVGRVRATGAAATSFTEGDLVAVGNIVDSCGACAMCGAGQENYCARFPTLTYAGADRFDGSLTHGAYSYEYVATQRFVYPLPGGLDPAAAAPLMCAGVTVWEPLQSSDVGPGMKVGIVGLGGLGHLALKFARALGADVALFTTSKAKTDDARALGADEVIVTEDTDALATQAHRFDVILDTASAPHDLSPYLRALRLDGTLWALGSLGSMEFDPLSLLIGRKRLASAGSGGTPATREMLDFCARHSVTADVEVLPAAEVNTALDRLRRGDVRYRFVLDLTDGAANV